MRFFVSILALAAATAATCLADGPAFVGPSGWSTDSSVGASNDATRTIMQWHLPGDTSTSLTYLRSKGSYDDALTAIHTNITTNKMKPAVDKDMPCQGKTAHVVEFATGPDGHKIVINRLLVPTTDGVAAITYAHADGTPPDPAVQKSETAYCAAAGT